jgi:hypothetical protein
MTGQVGNESTSRWQPGELELSTYVLAQQGTYLDGHEEPSWREQDTSSQLDALAAEFS